MVAWVEFELILPPYCGDSKALMNGPKNQKEQHELATQNGIASASFVSSHSRTNYIARGPGPDCSWRVTADSACITMLNESDSALLQQCM
jgi:hypothetical protein